MNAVGVIVEYNPFHNGHAYHMKQAKQASGAEIVIAAMSGNFLQRGEPALVSKWKRTEMALKAGADIVFELPYQFAAQQADIFASGAVSILEAAGCRSLCFGSESGNMNSFHRTLSFLEKQNDTYQNRVKFHLDEGCSYPKATSLAFSDIQPESNMVDLSKPNNILGFQYLKAARNQNASLKVLTVARKNAGYHDEQFSSDSIASATSIRKALFSENGEIETIRQYVPETTYSGLIEYKEKFGRFHQWEDYWPLLKYRLVHLLPEQLETIYEMEEGLEHRLLAAALQAETFQQFMELIKTKRYTWTRLQRACVHILTNTAKEEMPSEPSKSTYLRLLGMSKIGREYLNKHKADLPLPLISRVSSRVSDLLHLDIKASRVYALGVKGRQQQILLEQEFKQPPIMIQ
ncbi:putative nucleotidyltransferase [Cytobacillus oceanisediminis]|jgi:predicted nucleotidyltransferase|uniref:tRNA(Met) cytidine acetate ligase n=1 Tax=Cytobacillus oceanisediminis TaxID=665099 RepID=A0A2V2ZVV1_9BACI|nr:nucleotidyltransferase [Cytobacillus oceanisediminis]PWW27491.1 putative nucleotidyltransferase [Cytobacillus oceanisediminis]